MPANAAPPAAPARDTPAAAALAARSGLRRPGNDGTNADAGMPGAAIPGALGSDADGCHIGSLIGLTDPPPRPGPAAFGDALQRSGGDAGIVRWRAVRRQAGIAMGHPDSISPCGLAAKYASCLRTSRR
ncbi:hypothetical protein NIIDMKKI_15850 [Mycobacterium kansasii]|uniref:Uncharacterized protein n=1 Tax=Mycobacterium kansasii TaxID=1768 RepID=A0A7G1IA76_MYCKA|nr:hypothetical protein NIIDMKKI_15850 [Mycobacterium kansasii]